MLHIFNEEHSVHYIYALNKRNQSRILGYFEYHKVMAMVVTIFFTLLTLHRDVFASVSWLNC